MTDFGKVIDYITSYDPQFPLLIEGATLEEISILESLIPRPIIGNKLPDIYLSFLQKMGKSMDWLDIQGFDFSIDAAIEFYQQNPWLNPMSRQFIAKGHGERDLYLNFRLTRPRNRITSDIDSIANSFTEDSFTSVYVNTHRFVASSFTELFCLEVFHKFEIRGKNRKVADMFVPYLWQDDQDVLSPLDPLLANEGLEKLWFSDSSRAYLADDFAVRINTQKNVAFSVWVAANSTSIAERYLKKIEDYFDCLQG